MEVLAAGSNKGSNYNPDNSPERSIGRCDGRCVLQKRDIGEDVCIVSILCFRLKDMFWIEQQRIWHLPKGRDVINADWWSAFTRNSSFKINNCNNLSLSRRTLTRLPRPLGQGYKLVECISVTRVRFRTSKGITDLLLPQSSCSFILHVPLRTCHQWKVIRASI